MVSRYSWVHAFAFFKPGYIGVQEAFCQDLEFVGLEPDTVAGKEGLICLVNHALLNREESGPAS